MKTTKIIVLALAATMAVPQVADAKKPKKDLKNPVTEQQAELTTQSVQKAEEEVPVITDECMVNVSLFNESAKNKQFADALEPWTQVYTNCPNANKAIYTQGSKIIGWQISQAQTEEEKLALKNLLMEMYDKRIKWFGNDPKYPTAYILGEKAMEYCEYFTEDELQLPAYGWLKESIEGMRTNSKITVIAKFAELANKIYKSNPVEYAEQYLADYQLAVDVLGEIASDATNKNATAAQERKDYIDNVFALSGAADCDKLDELYAGLIQENIENIEVLNKVMLMYRRLRCTESNVYFSVAEAMHKLQPTAESAAGCAAMSTKKGNYKDAIAYYEQAASLTDNKEDKANYLYNCAVFYYEQYKSYTQARTYCQRSLAVNPNQGRCHILVGLMYANSSQIYDDPLLSKTVYWAACDKFAKAKQVDPSCAELANKMLNTYSKYFPTTEEMFFNAAKGLVEGESFTVGGWINETTTCRSK